MNKYLYPYLYLHLYLLVCLAPFSAGYAMESKSVVEEKKVDLSDSVANARQLLAQELVSKDEASGAVIALKAVVGKTLRVIQEKTTRENQCKREIEKLSAVAKDFEESLKNLEGIDKILSNMLIKAQEEVGRLVDPAEEVPEEQKDPSFGFDGDGARRADRELIASVLAQVSILMTGDYKTASFAQTRKEGLQAIKENLFGAISGPGMKGWGEEEAEDEAVAEEGITVVEKPPAKIEESSEEEFVEPRKEKDAGTPVDEDLLGDFERLADDMVKGAQKKGQSNKKQSWVRIGTQRENGRKSPRKKELEKETQASSSVSIALEEMTAEVLLVSKLSKVTQVSRLLGELIELEKRDAEVRAKRRLKELKEELEQVSATLKAARVKLSDCKGLIGCLQGRRKGGSQEKKAKEPGWVVVDKEN